MKRILSIVLLIVVVSSLVVFALPSFAFASTPPVADLFGTTWQFNDTVSSYQSTTAFQSVQGYAQMTSSAGQTFYEAGSYVVVGNLSPITFFNDSQSTNASYPMIRYTTGTGWRYYISSSSYITCPHGPIVTFTGGSYLSNSTFISWVNANAVPYSPPTYEDGYTAGYDEGYAAGIATESVGYSVFTDSSVSGVFTFQHSNGSITEVSRNNLTADYGYDSISFDTIADLMVSYGVSISAYFMRADMSIVLSEPFRYGSFPITVLGDPLAVENFIVVGTDNRPYYCSISGDSQPYTLTVNNATSSLHIKEFRFGCSSAAELLPTVSIIIPTSSYNRGFADGYNDGVSVTRFELENVVSESSASYIAGKNAGVASAGRYTFFGLISSIVEVPIKAFVGLTDFEILGVNLRTFYVSLLAFALLLTVLRLLLAR